MDVEASPPVPRLRIGSPSGSPFSENREVKDTSRRIMLGRGVMMAAFRDTGTKRSPSSLTIDFEVVIAQAATVLSQESTGPVRIRSVRSCPVFTLCGRIPVMLESVPGSGRSGAPVAGDGPQVRRRFGGHRVCHGGPSRRAWRLCCLQSATMCWHGLCGPDSRDRGDPVTLSSSRVANEARCP